MPYKVISTNCRVGGKVIPQGTILQDNQLIASAASALIASKQIEAVTPDPAPAPAPKPSKVTVAG